MQWAPDSPDLWVPDCGRLNQWAPDTFEHLTLRRGVDQFLGAKSAEGASPTADIESLPRIIEVKAVGGSQRGWFLSLEVPQVNAARTNPDFYVYIVDNVRQGDSSKFGLKILGGERLARLLEKAKQRSYCEVPVPVAEYYGAPGREAL